MLAAKSTGEALVEIVILVSFALGCFALERWSARRRRGKRQARRTRSGAVSGVRVTLPGLTGKRITYQQPDWEGGGWTMERYAAMHSRSRRLAGRLMDGAASSQHAQFVSQACEMLADPAYDGVYWPGLKLDDGDPLYWAVYDWLSWGSPVGPEALEPMLRQPDADVRGLGVLVACSRGLVDLAPPALDDPEPLVRALAVQGLSELSGWPASPRFYEAARDPSPLVRKALAEGLRHRNLAEIWGWREEVIRLLQDREVAVQTVAVMSLGPRLAGEGEVGRMAVTLAMLVGDQAESRAEVARHAAALVERLRAAPPPDQDPDLPTIGE